MWSCPTCTRTFKNANQRHHCEKTTSAQQLKGKPKEVIAMFNKIIAIADSLGKYVQSPIKDYIMLKNESTFLTIKPRKAYLDITFFLKEKSEEFPIFKSFQTSKNRVTHGARLENPEEVDKKIATWIAESYFLTSKKK